MSLAGCGNDRSSLETYQKTARVDNGLVDRYSQAQSPTEEYVNRIAKRVVLVSDRPSENYNIRVLDSYNQEFSIDRETHTIAISTGALAQLKDEAELAAVLSIAMSRLEQAPQVDRETMQTLANAGYDPQAMLDLQEQYFYSSNKQQNWLGEVFPAVPTEDSITANKQLVQEMPKGLLRGSEGYSQKVNG